MTLQITELDVKRCLSDALAICSVPAPTFAEEDRARLITRRLTTYGLQVKRGESGNVYCRMGGPGPAVVFAAHLDTVFPADTDLRPRLEGARIMTPGFADNSLGLAGLLVLAEKLSGMNLRRPALLVATVGEEGLGNLRGAREIIEKEAVAEFIAVEGIGLGDISCSGPGSVRWQISVSGPGGHSWSNRGQESAVESLIGFLGSAARLRDEDLFLNIGEVEGGSAPGAIAAEARGTLEIRSLDNRSLQSAEQAAQELFRRSASESSLVWLIEELGRRPGGQSPRGGLYRELVLVCQKIGIEAKEAALSTDANIAYASSIPAVALGLAEGGALHSLDEWCDPTRLREGLSLLVGLAARRCL